MPSQKELEAQYKEILEKGRTQGLRSLNDYERKVLGLDSNQADIMMSYISPTRSRTSYDINFDEINQQRVAQGLSPIGDSTYDKRATTVEDLLNIDNLRGEEQSGLVQIGNGIVKMATTAATTFANGVLGTIWGLGEGMYSLFDSDDTTSFASGFTMNHFNKWMNEFNDYMETVAPNYYTDIEKDNAWYKSVLTPNFLGDKLLKNAGFTIGAMATMAVPGFNSGLGIAKGASMLAKAAGAGANTVNNIGKYGTFLVNAFLSANGEANIEAYQAAKSYSDLNKNYLDGNRQKAEALIQAEFERDLKQGMSYKEAEIHANAKKKELEKAYIQAQQQIKEESTHVANNVWLGNITALMTSNALQFTSMLKGGYNTSKGIANSLNKVIIKEGDQVIHGQNALGKALAKGTAKIEAKPVKHSGLKIAGKWVGNAFTEGLEELTQNLISGTYQAKYSAELNKWANQKYRHNSDKYSLFASSINPETTKEYLNTVTALGHVWEDEFGTAASPGWEEFTLGALTGGFGTVSARRKKSGKIGIDWQGGIVEAFRDVQNKKAKNELQAETIRKALGDPKYRERIQHAIAAMTIAQDMDKALEDSDIFAFKNSELLSIVNDALYYKKMGMSNLFTSYYKELAKGISEATINDIKVLTAVSNGQINPNTGKKINSYFSDKRDEDIKKLFREKALSTLDKVNNAIDTYDNLYNNYHDSFLEEVEGDELMVNKILTELTAKKSLVDDIQKRILELQKSYESDNNTLSASVKRSILKDLNRLTKLKNDLQEDISHIQEDPNIAVNRFTSIENRVNKAQVAKNTEPIAEAIMKAKTWQQVMKAFEGVDNLIAIQAIKKVLKEGTDENKKLLRKAQLLTQQANSINTVVHEIIKEKMPKLSKDDENYITESIGNYLNEILQKAFNDEIDLTDKDLSDVIEDWATNEEDNYASDTKEDAIFQDQIKTLAKEIAKKLKKEFENFDFNIAELDQMEKEEEFNNKIKDKDPNKITKEEEKEFDELVSARIAHEAKQKTEQKTEQKAEQRTEQSSQSTQNDQTTKNNDETQSKEETAVSPLLSNEKPSKVEDDSDLPTTFVQFRIGPLKTSHRVEEYTFNRSDFMNTLKDLIGIDIDTINMGYLSESIIDAECIFLRNNYIDIIMQDRLPDDSKEIYLDPIFTAIPLEAIFPNIEDLQKQNSVIQRTLRKATINVNGKLYVIIGILQPKVGDTTYDTVRQGFSQPYKPPITKDNLTAAYAWSESVQNSIKNSEDNNNYIHTATFENSSATQQEGWYVCKHESKITGIQKGFIGLTSSGKSNDVAMLKRNPHTNPMGLRTEDYRFAYVSRTSKGRNKTLMVSNDVNISTEIVDQIVKNNPPGTSFICIPSTVGKENWIMIPLDPITVNSEVVQNTPVMNTINSNILEAVNYKDLCRNIESIWALFDDFSYKKERAWKDNGQNGSNPNKRIVVKSDGIYIVPLESSIKDGNIVTFENYDSKECRKIVDKVTSKWNENYQNRDITEDEKQIIIDAIKECDPLFNINPTIENSKLRTPEGGVSVVELFESSGIFSVRVTHLAELSRTPYMCRLDKDGNIIDHKNKNTSDYSAPVSEGGGTSILPSEQQSNPNLIIKEEIKLIDSGKAEDKNLNLGTNFNPYSEYYLMDSGNIYSVTFADKKYVELVDANTKADVLEELARRQQQRDAEQRHNEIIQTVEERTVPEQSNTDTEDSTESQNDWGDQWGYENESSADLPDFKAHSTEDTNLPPTELMNSQTEDMPPIGMPLDSTQPITLPNIVVNSNEGTSNSNDNTTADESGSEDKKPVEKPKDVYSIEYIAESAGMNYIYDINTDPSVILQLNKYLGEWNTGLDLVKKIMTLSSEAQTAFISIHNYNDFKTFLNLLKCK